MVKQIICAMLFFIFSFNPSYSQPNLNSKESATKKESSTILSVIEKNITVNGKPSRVFDIVQPNGFFGYEGTEGEDFDVTVENKTVHPLTLHWHGIIDPNAQDGVPYVTQLPIAPNASYHYKFKLKQAGTYWMHSHYKLQEQRLMAAPLIIHSKNPSKAKEVVMFIQDFSFTNPKKIYAELRKHLSQSHGNSRMHPLKSSSTSSMSGMGQEMDEERDVNDVKFDAYLTNHKTLQNPDVIQVEKNAIVLLRIINASASSNYFIDLGKLQGTLVAMDGEAIEPIIENRFQMAIGNRLDIQVRIPPEGGAFPILALPEGVKQQTGLVLSTAGASIPQLSERTQSVNPITNNEQELKLRARNALPAHEIAQSLNYILDGNMQSYRWTINGQEWPYITPFIVKPGERIELVFKNKSMMAHPMHLHGHVFEISEIDGQRFNGRKGDTINVMPNSTVKVLMDTDNPGIWMLHCHILYHQQGGMMTTFNYKNYPNGFTLKQRLEGADLYTNDGA